MTSIEPKSKVVEQVDCGDNRIFTIHFEFEADPYYVRFEVFRPGFEHPDNQAPDFEGSVKWDGCTDINTPVAIHWCSFEDMTNFQRLMGHISIRAANFMGKNSDFQFGPDWVLLSIVKNPS